MEEHINHDAVADNEYDTLHDTLNADEAPKGASGKDEDQTKEDERRRRRRTRSPSPRRRHRSRSRSRDRDRRYRQRSRTPDRYRRRSPSPHRSRRSRYRSRTPPRERRRDRSRDRGSYGRDYYGEDIPGGMRDARSKMQTVEDPFARLRSATAATMDPAEIARKMQEQQLKAREVVLQQQALSTAAAAAKALKEVYVGNLIPGIVNEAMVREVFNSNLAPIAAAISNKGSENGDAIKIGSPVVNVNLAAGGKYCFMELASPDLTQACLQLNGQVTLMGAILSIGRPTGFLDPVKAQLAAVSASEALARFIAENEVRSNQNVQHPTNDETIQHPTSFLRLHGMVTADVLKNDAEYNDVLQEIRNEFDKHGLVLRVLIPRPVDLSMIDDDLLESREYGYVLVQFLESKGAESARNAVNGRLFAGQTVSAEYVLAKEYLEMVTRTQAVVETAIVGGEATERGEGEKE